MYYNSGKSPFRALLMNRIPLSLSKKIHIITAGIISLLAQGILLIPSRLEFILGYLPSWGGVAIGAALFAISILSFFTAIRSITAKDTSRWRANEAFLAIEILDGDWVDFHSATCRLTEARSRIPL